MKKRFILREILIATETFVMILLASSSIVTVNFFLFLRNFTLEEQTIRTNAPVTFFNIVFISLLFTGISTLRRYTSVIRPTQRILSALDAITAGDFDARIEKGKLFGKFSQIADSINLTAEELKSVETLKTDFISNVSHEMKTPLSGIKSYAQLLLMPGITDSERQEYTLGVISCADRMNALITNILKLSKLENNCISQQKERFDLVESLTDCILSFESTIDEKNISLNIDLPEKAFILSDRELLEIVWNNLLSNALKFTPSGGEISISLTTQPDATRVCIADSGQGMDERTIKHIFEKFYQGDVSHAANGNGLGLALVKSVLKITDSDILVSSAPGIGSSFTVIINNKS